MSLIRVSPGATEGPEKTEAPYRERLLQEQRPEKEKMISSISTLFPGNHLSNRTFLGRKPHMGQDSINVNVEQRKYATGSLVPEHLSPTSL